MCIDGGEFLEAKVSQGTSQSLPDPARASIRKRGPAVAAETGATQRGRSPCEMKRWRLTETRACVCVVSEASSAALNERTFEQGGFWWGQRVDLGSGV